MGHQLATGPQKVFVSAKGAHALDDSERYSVLNKSALGVG